MTTAARKVIQTTRFGPGWRLIACLVLVAFALQVQITQTHTHSIGPGFGQSVISGQHFEAPLPQKQPNNGGPGNCAFCQAVAHAGIFVMPAIQLLVPAAWVMSEAPSARRSMRAGTSAYDWRSRGPPLS